MKKLILISLPIYLLGLIYLSLPSPTSTDLPNAQRSQEPGDTWQNPDQKAFFTDQSREEVIAFYQSNFSISLLDYTLPNLRLNYRPEDTGTYVRKHIDSNYLEEIILPLRESIFISGWEPQNSPKYSLLPPEERQKQVIQIDGVIYNAKITLKPYYSSFWARFLVWTLIFPATYLVFWSASKSLSNLKSSLK